MIHFIVSSFFGAGSFADSYFFCGSGSVFSTTDAGNSYHWCLRSRQNCYIGLGERGSHWLSLRVLGALSVPSTTSEWLNKDA